MKKSTYLIALLFLTNVCLAQSAEMEVMMKMLSLKTALLKKDSALLSSLLSNDVTYGHSNGLIQTKPQLIRSVVSGEQDYKTIDPSDMNVRLFGNTGVVTMKSNVSMIYNKAPMDVAMFITLVWIKMDKDWKLVARQSVKL